MSSIYLILGIILLIMAVSDIVWTILWVDRGGGPCTRRLTALSWNILRNLTGGNSRVFSIAGPVTVSITILTWVLLLWAGWTFVFAGGDISLNDTQNRGEVSWTDTIYFAGYTLFTLGIGDFVPTFGRWQIATVLASGCGMLLITMSASYVISILSGVTQKRSFADSITGVAGNGSDLVKAAWDGKDFKNIELFLITYTAQLSTITAQHKAYPILHYYHSSDNKKALATAVAIFDEALTIFQYGISKEQCPNHVLLQNARSSIGSYLDTQDSAYVKPAKESPPGANISLLREAGLPVKTDEEFERAMAEQAERRRKLWGLIKADARKWPS